MERIPWPFTRFYNGCICRYMASFYHQIAQEISEKGISGSILDVGTGPGWLPIKVAELVPTATIVGIDISDDVIKIARKNAKQAQIEGRVRFAKSSIYETDFGDSSFDLVISTGLIHHLKKPTLAFNEIHRLLKPRSEALMYDGRRDASRDEIRATIGDIERSGLALPLWVIERVWPHIHVGYKTEDYMSGIVTEALRQSEFKDYEAVIDKACIKIILRKE